VKKPLTQDANKQKRPALMKGPGVDLVARLLSEAFAFFALAFDFASATNGFRLFAGALFRWLLVITTELHFTENAFTLKLFLQNAKGLVDIVVTH
jgi:hypothetical protein